MRNYSELSHKALRRTYPLGVFRDQDEVALVGREKYSTTYQLVIGHTTDHDFQLGNTSPSIVLPLGRTQALSEISDVRISQVLDQRVMTYTAEVDGVSRLYVAVHDEKEEMDVWDVPAVNNHLTGSGMVVADYMHEGQYVLFYGDRSINVAFSKNLVAWHAGGNAVAAPRHDWFDRSPLKIVSVAHIEQGLLVIYESRSSKRGQVSIMFGVILCASDNPERVIWRSEEPLQKYTGREKDGISVLGAIVYENEIAVYLTSRLNKLFVIEFANPYASPVKPHHRLKLHRFPQNPVLSPTHYEWESEAVYNPAAFVDDGRVHLLYRAMGPDGISRLGYASSEDGIHFDERLEYPVFTPRKGLGLPSPEAVHGPKAYDIIAHPSGGGWAGCEDPRAVKIDGKVYVSYVAFDGWSFVRQALTSISLSNVHAKNWRWRRPVLISKPGEIQKNWVIFPEKVNGKYAILHGLSPKVHIEYVDSLDHFNGKKYIESLPQAGGGGYSGRKDHWDNRVRGSGAPPIKTAMGWLLLYHATDKRDPGKYKLGAMLLDLKDPTKILFRSNSPLLEPEEWYENQGKPGVVYTCGAVILGDNLIVYYGGGDKHIAIARANATQFLKALAAGDSMALTQVTR
ncbi:MAG TPA: hypothetical protein VMS08_04570 [Candidatus Saccharimonadia bacterium]|nr:hypothetical protein [Candidatus Saccharimonadia bacterium]